MTEKLRQIVVALIGGVLAGVRPEIASLCAEVRAALDDLARARRPRRNLNARLLTKRAVARLLGVDRGGTLERWIRDGSIRVVQVGGRARIPRSEVDRIAEEGLPGPSGAPPPPRRRGRPSGRSHPPRPGVGDRIRSLDV